MAAERYARGMSSGEAMTRAVNEIKANVEIANSSFAAALPACGHSDRRLAAVGGLVHGGAPLRAMRKGSTGSHRQGVKIYSFKLLGL